MKNSKHFVSVLILFAIGIVGVSAQAQPRRNRGADRQVGSILQRLEQSSTRFRGSLNLVLVNGRIDETRPQNDINTFEPAFSSAIDQFTLRFTRRQAVTADVQNILQKASLVNGFMNRNRLNVAVQNDWAQVRTDLNALASAYGVSWQWNQQRLPPIESSRSSRLPDSQLNQLIQRVETGGDRFRSSLTNAFDRNPYNQTRGEGNMIAAVGDLKDATDQLRNQFDARQPLVDYVARVLARATPIDTYMSNNRLTTQAQTDWATLRADLNTLAGALNVSATWQNGTNQGSSQQVAGSRNTRANSGEFVMRDGETVVAVLNNDLTTKQAKQGDRFTMTVRDGEYEGAVISGTVGNVSQGGRLTGRSGMSLNFDTIQLRNGQTYKFAGILTSVRTLNGDTVKVDNEGSAQGDNQTTQTLERAGIGTAIGAIIGAVAGGGKGAAIGGVIGAAGGAGSVYVTGKDNLDLPTGTELTIRAGAPSQ
jgi:hypothetical protein